METIALECELYLQVVMIQCQNVEDKDKGSSSNTEINCSFQVKSAISQHLFKLDPDWIEESF